MPLLDGDLAALFGAALGGLYLDATLTKRTTADTGSGGFATTSTDCAVKALIEAASDKARAARGIPDNAVTLSVLRAGLTVEIDLDDAVSVSGRTYRVIRADRDPAGAAFTLTAVPA